MGQRQSVGWNTRTMYQPGSGVNDPYADVPGGGYVRKGAVAAGAKLLQGMANRALFNPRARFGGEAN